MFCNIHSKSFDNKPSNKKITMGEKKLRIMFNKMLMDFFSKTKKYQSSLDSIYNKYTRSYGTINTYGSCGDYSIGCFSTGPSENRKKALDELKKIN